MRDIGAERKKGEKKRDKIVQTVKTLQKRWNL